MLSIPSFFAILITSTSFWSNKYNNKFVINVLLGWDQIASPHTHQIQKKEKIIIGGHSSRY